MGLLYKYLDTMRVVRAVALHALGTFKTVSADGINMRRYPPQFKSNFLHPCNVIKYHRLMLGH